MLFVRWCENYIDVAGWLFTITFANYHEDFPKSTGRCRVVHAEGKDIAYSVFVYTGIRVMLQKPHFNVA